jgi:hypothetical protein
MEKRRSLFSRLRGRRSGELSADATHPSADAPLPSADGTHGDERSTGVFPCFICGKVIPAHGGFNTIHSGGTLYACHSSGRDCDGGQTLDTFTKLQRLDELSAEEKLRSRVLDPETYRHERLGAAADEQPLPADEERAARRLGELLERFPMHAMELGQDRSRLLWDTHYIDAHQNEDFFRERHEILEIGRQLDHQGGLALMERVATRATKVGPEGGEPVSWVQHHLDKLWNGIGNWQH